MSYFDNCVKLKQSLIIAKRCMSLKKRNINHLSNQINCLYLTNTKSIGKSTVAV